MSKLNKKKTVNKKTISKQTDGSLTGMMEAFYTQEVMEHFLHPHHAGALAEYDAVGEVGNVVCGDVMRIYLKIEPDDNQQLCIANISFETYGCGAAIATSSVTCDLALGKTLQEALALNKQAVIEQLQYLPAQKIHCSILAIDALHEAIYQYYQYKKHPIPENLAKIHQRLTKQKEILKKQYQKWMGN